ncbi:MAG: CBS domain-containing protein, partial [Synergistetes bacterium]|nr:CBS domain-containing protein [Synergistota bacterium]
MDREFLKLHPEDTIDKLIWSFTQEETAAIIVDENDKLLGVITMKDFLRTFTPLRRYSIVGLSSLRRSILSKTSMLKDIM